MNSQDSKPSTCSLSHSSDISDTCRDVVLIYIDNSNIFINTQKYAAKTLNFKYGIKQDIRSRVNIGKLVDLAKKDRELIHAKLYGSEPPALDTVWSKIRKQNFEVTHSKRSTWDYREKKTDTQFVADAVKDIITYKDQVTKNTNNSSVILFTGDKDMLPVVAIALENGWNVEIWAYKNSINAELVHLKSKNVQIHLIDDYFDQIVFWVFDSTKILPRDRTIICRNESEAKQLLKFVIIESSKLFELPTIGRFLNDNNAELAIFPTMPPEYKSRGNTIKYNFYKDIFLKTPELKSIINCAEIKTLVKDIQNYQDKYEFSEEEEEEEKQNDKDELGFGGFIPVMKKERKKKQQYSDPCRYQFCCSKGKDCKYDHSEMEKEYFKEQPKVGVRLKYKTVQCLHPNCKYKKTPHLCSYAHGLLEARISK